MEEYNFDDIFEKITFGEVPEQFEFWWTKRNLFYQMCLT